MAEDKWVTRVTTLLIGVVTTFTTGRGHLVERLLIWKIHVYPNGWPNIFVNNLMIATRLGYPVIPPKNYPACLRKRRWNLTSPIEGKRRSTIHKSNAANCCHAQPFYLLKTDPNVQNADKEFTTTSGFLILRSGWTIWWWQQLRFVERYQDGQAQFDLHAELDEGFSRVPCIEKAMIF